MGGEGKMVEDGDFDMVIEENNGRWFQIVLIFGPTWGHDPI